ncbi:MAG: lysozyme [Pseudomonadota bacterium]
MANKHRIAIGSLALSASALVGLAVHEGYTDTAVIPVKGDVPTLGFGMTQRPDGSPVQMGDRTNPLDALKRTLAYTQNADAQIRQCVTAPLHQKEFDLMADFGYQYGIRALCKSSIVARANAGDYRGSCEAYKLYRFVAGYDCSTPGNRRCMGVWNRQLERYTACMEAQ